MSFDKPDPEAVASEVADSLVGHLGSVVDTDGFVRAATPDLRVEGVSELLRYRLLATGSWPGREAGGDWATTTPAERERVDAPRLDTADEQTRGQPATTTADGTAVGVLDFLALLPARLRTLDPATDDRRRVQRGRADGRVDWQATRRHRMRTGGADTAFVTRATTAETLSERTRVLVWLLTRLRETARDALATFRGDPNNGDETDDTGVPPWLTIWDDTDPEHGDVDTPRSVLTGALTNNPHLDGVDTRDLSVTDRAIDTVTRDRDPLYVEAAALARELRRLEGGLPAADADDLADLFRIEAFQPDPTESHDGATVFELYWALQLLDTVPSQHLSRFDAGGDQVLSHWREGDSEYLLCHDTDGTVELAGTRREFVDFVAAHHWDDTPLADAETRRGYLRQHYVELAAASGISRGYGEKEPDLLVFEFDADADGWVLRRLFVGEVKFSPNLERVRSGLQELVEYAGFARVGADARLPDGDSDGTPVAGEDFLDDRIELGLFVGDDDRVERIGRETLQARGWKADVDRPL